MNDQSHIARPTGPVMDHAAILARVESARRSRSGGAGTLLTITYFTVAALLLAAPAIMNFMSPSELTATPTSQISDEALLDADRTSSLGAPAREKPRSLCSAADTCSQPSWLIGMP